MVSLQSRSSCCGQRSVLRLISSSAWVIILALCSWQGRMEGRLAEVNTGGRAYGHVLKVAPKHHHSVLSINADDKLVSK